MVDWRSPARQSINMSFDRREHVMSVYTRVCGWAGVLRRGRVIVMAGLRVGVVGVGPGSVLARIRSLPAAQPRCAVSRARTRELTWQGIESEHWDKIPVAWSDRRPASLQPACLWTLQLHPSDLQPNLQLHLQRPRDSCRARVG